MVMELARCEYIDRHENVIALGPSGVGKTHIALGFGLAACQKGLKVRFTAAAVVLPGKSRGTFDNVILSGGPYEPTSTPTFHG